MLQHPIIDFLCSSPLLLAPPGGFEPPRANIRYEDEFRDGRGGDGGADESDAGVLVDGFGACGAAFAAGAGGEDDVGGVGGGEDGVGLGLGFDFFDAGDVDGEIVGVVFC